MNIVMDIVLGIICVVSWLWPWSSFWRRPQETQPRVNRAADWPQVRVNVTFWAMAKDLEEAR